MYDILVLIVSKPYFIGCCSLVVFLSLIRNGIQSPHNIVHIGRPLMSRNAHLILISGSVHLIGLVCEVLIEYS